jgi:hypothetical protein
MINLKHQKGNLLVFFGFLLTAVTFYLTVFAQKTVDEKNDVLISELRLQIKNYLFALDLYGSTNCAAQGVIDESDIYPAYASSHWKPPYRSDTGFFIDGVTGQRSISLTFANQNYYNHISNINWIDMVIEKDPASLKLTFTQGRETSPSHGRSNYNRNLFISATPNGCF